MSADFTDPAAADPRLRADPLADAAAARIFQAYGASRWDAAACIERAMAGWDDNAALGAWTADEGTPAEAAAALEDYLAQARRLPDWFDAGKVGCAEAVFADAGLVAPTLLACASQPEADVAVDPLGQSLDERLRAAAALQCALLLPGGLLEPGGAGLAQLVKLRLEHALLRHLVVRGHPAEAMAHGVTVPALLPEGAGRWRTLFARGWDLRANGLPRNQEELAYALLTRHYVFLRGLRRLGLGLSRQAERAWLHAWNVAGHLLGIEEALLAATMKDAAVQFERLQRSARAGADARYAAPLRKGVPAHGKTVDPRPALGAALMRALQDEIGSRLFKPFPLLLARRLCGPATVRALGLDGGASFFARTLFALEMGAARAVDTAARLLCPGLSSRRLAARVLGYRVVRRFLRDPLGPVDVAAALDACALDPQAPRFVKAIERRCRPQRGRGASHEAAAC